MVAAKHISRIRNLPATSILFNCDVMVKEKPFYLEWHNETIPDPIKELKQIYFYFVLNIKIMSLGEAIKISMSHMTICTRFPMLKTWNQNCRKTLQ
jgi:hypothetical protein